MDAREQAFSQWAQNEGIDLDGLWSDEIRSLWVGWSAGWAACQNWTEDETTRDLLADDARYSAEE